MSTSVSPYIITIGRLSEIPPVSKLVAAKVSAVIVEVSDYFDMITHHPSSKPINPKMVSQVKYLKTYQFPFGLYFKLRGRTISEIQAETTFFTRTILGMLPSVGVWAELHLTGANTMNANDLLIDACKKILVAAGYQNQIGIYSEPKQLTKFHWKDRSKDWVIWLNQHVTSSVELNSILSDDVVTSDFFEVK